jgi:hypothetical protein
MKVDPPPQRFRFVPLFSPFVHQHSDGSTAVPLQNRYGLLCSLSRIGEILWVIRSPHGALTSKGCYPVLWSNASARIAGEFWKTCPACASWNPHSKDYRVAWFDRRGLALHTVRLLASDQVIPFFHLVSQWQAVERPRFSGGYRKEISSQVSWYRIGLASIWFWLEKSACLGTDLFASVYGAEICGLLKLSQWKPVSSCCWLGLEGASGAFFLRRCKECLVRYSPIGPWGIGSPTIFFFSAQGQRVASLTLASGDPGSLSSLFYLASG